MQYGVCNLAVVPLRAKPSDRSEMTSQVLFGETFEILEWQERWVKITTAFDRYEGWLNRLHVSMIGHIAYRILKQTPAPLTYRAVTQAWKIADNTTLYLPVGSSLIFLTGTSSQIAKDKYEIIGEIGERESLAVTAKSFLNTPYLWGGRTHFGTDCSGFTQAVFRLQGIDLMRDAGMQAQQGKIVHSLSDAMLGDLAFFNNTEGKITHVGILLNNNEIIHASGKVKIERIDDEGIYSDELNRHTHKLNSVRRLFF